MSARVVETVTLAASPRIGNRIEPITIRTACRASEDRGWQHGVRAELNFRSLAGAKAAGREICARRGPQAARAAIGRHGDLAIFLRVGGYRSAPLGPPRTRQFFGRASGRAISKSSPAQLRPILKFLAVPRLSLF